MDKTATKTEKLYRAIGHELGQLNELLDLDVGAASDDELMDLLQTISAARAKARALVGKTRAAQETEE